MDLKAFEKIAGGLPETSKLPVLFSSHGNPMDMIADIHSTPFFKTVGAVIAGIQKSHQIHAVLMISAHWYTRGTYVNINKFPEMIYDYYGFPEEYYRIKYGAPGSPELAREIASLLPKVRETEDWGFDHGSWPLLRQMFPKADMPVVHMSVDHSISPQQHFDLAKLLSSLRKKGVLIIGSGNIVHNLQQAGKKFMVGDFTPYGWDSEFDQWVGRKVEERDFKSLIHYEKARLGLMAAPTPDHYVPMLYSLGLVERDEPIETTYEAVYAAYSERSFKIG